MPPREQAAPEAPCYLNGEYLPLSQARISPLDRGFLYADGVYELIPVFARRPFRLDAHLDRLQRSLDGIRLPNPHPRAAWVEIIRSLVDAAPWDNQSLYLQITRGAGTCRDMPFPEASSPTVFLFAAPLAEPSARQREAGLKAMTVADIRWGRCDLKTLALLPNVLARQAAAEAGCDEAILLRDGYLSEGASSNIFIVQNGIILAPPKDHYMLPGTTYDVVLELAAQHGAPYQIRAISEAEMRTADELWRTSSSKGVLAITTLDGHPVGRGENAGKPGPLMRRMHAWYDDFLNDEIRRNPLP